MTKEFGGARAIHAKTRVRVERPAECQLTSEAMFITYYFLPLSAQSVGWLVGCSNFQL